MIEQKEMQKGPMYPVQCKRGCFNITEERRKSLFTFFWNLQPQRRRDWLIRCAHPVPIKWKKTDSPKSTRSITYEYDINNDNDERQ